MTKCCSTDRRVPVVDVRLAWPGSAPTPLDPHGKRASAAACLGAGCRASTSGVGVVVLGGVVRAPAMTYGKIAAEEVAEAARGEPDRPSAGSDSALQRDRSSRVGKADLVGSFARGPRIFWASLECAGRGLEACPGTSMC